MSDYNEYHKLVKNTKATEEETEQKRIAEISANSVKERMLEIAAESKRKKEEETKSKKTEQQKPAKLAKTSIDRMFTSTRKYNSTRQF